MIGWDVVIRTPERRMVLYNKESREIRTLVSADPSNNDALFYESEYYFQLLNDIFLSRNSLPPPISEYTTDGYFKRFFPIRKFIGSGGFGKVFKVEHRLAGLKIADYAVKVVPVGENNFAYLNRSLGEVRLLEDLGKNHHPFILSYKHCWLEQFKVADFGPEITCLFILMEYAEIGNIESFIRSRGLPLSEMEKWQIVLTASVAIKYIHSRNIIHRDIKLSNLLVFTDVKFAPLGVRIALCDFGTATKYYGRKFGNERTGATGTMESIAPELLELDEHNGFFIQSHTFASDMWSLGVVFFTVFTGVSPFLTAYGEKLLREFTTVENLCKSLKINGYDENKLEWKWINKFMRRNPSERANLNDFLNDPEIFKKLKDLGIDEFIDFKYQQASAFAPSPSVQDIKSSQPVVCEYDSDSLDEITSFPYVPEVAEGRSSSRIRKVKPENDKKVSRKRNDTKCKREIDFDNSHYRQIALKVAYIGWNLKGFVAQNTTNETVEYHLFEALKRAKLVKDKESSFYSLCGRTDAGVSGIGNVISVRVRSVYPYGVGVLKKEGAPEKKEEYNYIQVLNGILPDYIRITGEAYVPLTFNARFECTKRGYRYFFYKFGKDIEKMKEAAEKLIGEHDYRAFCKFSPESTSHCVRRIYSIEFGEAENGIYYFEIKGNGFIWHQIRCIASVLFAVGDGYEDTDITEKLLDVSKFPGRPNYMIADPEPLVFWGAEYDNLEWRIDNAQSSKLKINFSNQLTELHMKSAVVKCFLNGDEIEPPKKKTYTKIENLDIGKSVEAIMEEYSKSNSNHN